ncbi:MAG: dienelactone hydrolase family protein [Oligoflexia bacterium]|nr:dienelactone hydrolase family protein [Oligoflexia bacterium]
MVAIFLSILIPIFSFSNEGFIEKTIPYGQNKFEGYYIRPLNKLALPGILMVHNWMGITDETKAQAKRYAELGYAVFAADIYGKGIRPKNTKEAAELATKYKTDRKLFRKNLKLALTTLEKTNGISKNRIAVLGYCFGGTGAIELARTGSSAKAFISFHGGLDSPEPKLGKNIKGKVVAHHGAIDPFVKADDLKAFEAEMKTNKIDYKIIPYEGAVHSFTEKAAGDDISKGAAYNEKADLQSFQYTKDLLSELF